MSIKGQGHFFTLAKGQLKLNVELNFLSNHLTNQSHFYMQYPWDRETKIYVKGLSHMTKMAVMAINSKNLQKSSSPEPEGLRF